MRVRARVAMLLSVALVSAVMGGTLALAPPAGAAPTTLSFVDSASTAGNRVNHSVTIPSGVRAGDTLVAFLTTNSTSSTVGDPPGWTVLQSRDGSGVRGRAYAKTAVAADAGATLTISTSAFTKSVLSVSAYRSDGGASSVTDSAISVVDSSGASLTTPGVEVADANSWVVSDWSEKSSTDVTFTLPAGAARRSGAAGSGSGKVSGVVADSGGPVAVGAVAGATATTSATVGRRVTYSVVVSPGGDPGPQPNRAPEASFTVDCVSLTCRVDAAASSDPDGDSLTYRWDWGDATPSGSGVTAEHTYASAGTRTVTLTVSDGDLNGTATRTATTTAPPGGPAGDLVAVGADQTAGNRSSHRATIPGAVRPGDTLLLFLTTNSTSSTIADPSGWLPVQSRDGNGVRGRAWSRTAAPGDAGTEVVVTTSGLAKSVMSLAAYRSSVAASKVTASASDLGNSSDATLTAPAVDVAEPNSWVVSYWSEKSSTTTTWQLPAGVTPRGTSAATGSGKISATLADSGAPAAVGTAPARVANVTPAASRNINFSLAISPGTDAGNRAPVASFTVNCASLTCEADAANTYDLDGDPLDYSWDWGDGSPIGSGVTAIHKYATPATRTVTLTVGDGTVTASATRQATTTPPIPGPGHTAIVPETPRTNTPLISDGEIWDIEVIGNRAFYVGSFTSVRNNAPGNTTSYNQPGIVAFNLDTGLVDANFRPNVTGSLDAVEASPDGTKLFVSGSFSAINGVTKSNVASLNPATGDPVVGFDLTTDGRTKQLAVSNTTVYLGGRFTRVNGAVRRSLGAVDINSGALVTNFVNDLTGGIGVSGALGVQKLVLSHDMRTLVVIHTGRQVNGHDRYGVALINAVTNQLLPWRTRLWQDNLQYVGGIQRACNADISPDDSYFVVVSGSGGDRPPINDTAIRLPIDGGANVEPAWISRQFDSTYSVAVTEQGVYIGGHFAWNESPSSRDPWPGLDDVGYGTGQGLSGYGLGDEVVRREHLGLLDPETGKAREWYSTSNSFEGEKAMLAIPRGLLIGGDGTTKGGYNVGRIGFYDFNSVPAANGTDTTITDPIAGRIKRPDQEFTVTGSATAPAGVNRVELTVYDRQTGRYLADDLTTWQTANNTIQTNLASPFATATEWSLPLTITNNREMELRARAFSSSGAQDPSPAIKKFETFGLSDQPPNTNVTGPSGAVIASRTFTITGSATDDVGVRALSLTLQDEATGRYLQDDGSVGLTYNSFGFEPDVVGATNTTWSFQATVPFEGRWTVRVRSSDTAGQADLDTADRTWLVDSNAVPPTVTVSAPAAMLPPTTTQTVQLAPGHPVTFAGHASDDEDLARVEIQLRNTTTGERLAADGSWSLTDPVGWYRVGPSNINGRDYDWSYTTPFDLSPGSYTFTVRAIDELGLEPDSSMRGRLTLLASIPGDNPPDTRITPSGTQTGLTELKLDLAGTATDDLGVERVKVAIRENDTSRFLQADGTLNSDYYARDAVLDPPGGTSATWSLPTITLPMEGDYSVTAIAYDTVGQQDPSTTGATSRYPVYPGDMPPEVLPDLMQPTSGAVFDDGRIVISGRVVDDRQIAAAQVAVVDSEGRYMSSSGTFTNTTASWRTAFLNSPGSPGSNYSYTTPIIPAGVYRVLVRGVDHHGFATEPPAEATNVTVNTPPNDPPVADFTYSCNENVCVFDARSSTDENTPTLTYTWNYGQGTGSGPLPTKIYTAAGTFTVTLTARDEYGLTATTSRQVTIVEPAGNVAPVPVINPPSCAGLQCNFSSVGSADPNTGDTFTRRWTWGDNTTASTATSPSHTFPSPGTYTVTLTVTDGWGKSATATLDVTVT